MDTKIMEEDLFAENDFYYEKVVKLINRKDPKIISEYKFKLKEITGFESDRISKGAMKLNAHTGEMEINQEDANIKFLRACIVSAPFDLNEENIRKLSKKVRDELIDYCRKINEISEDVEKK